MGLNIKATLNASCVYLYLVGSCLFTFNLVNAKYHWCDLNGLLLYYLDWDVTACGTFCYFFGSWAAFFAVNMTDIAKTKRQREGHKQQ